MKENLLKTKTLERESETPSTLSIPLSLDSIKSLIKNASDEQWERLAIHQLSDSYYTANTGRAKIIASENRFITKGFLTELHNLLIHTPRLYVYEEDGYIPAGSISIRPKPENYHKECISRINTELDTLFTFDSKKEILKIQSATKEQVSQVTSALKIKGDISHELEVIANSLITEITENDNEIFECKSLANLCNLDNCKSMEHSIRVLKITNQLARILGFRGGDLDFINKSALLHDIGKSLIPSEIILKEGALADDEFEIIKLHAHLSFLILSNREKMINALSVVAGSHHKKEDPNHKKSYGSFTTHRHYLQEGSLEKAQDLQKEPLTVAAQRIVYLADVCEALTCKRPYKKDFTLLETLQIMDKEDREGGSYSPYFNKMCEMFIHDSANRNRILLEEAMVTIETLIQNNRFDPNIRTAKRMRYLGQTIKKHYANFVGEDVPTLESLQQFKTHLLKNAVKESFNLN